MRIVARMVYAVVLGAAVVTARPSAAQEVESHPLLAKALGPEHITLAKGLAGAASAGRAISTQYEYEGGKLQLSVFVEKGGAFYEIIVDHHTGKIATTEKMTDPADLKDARAQSAAMAKSKSTLETALTAALTANPGYEGISVEPKVEGGKVTAEVKIRKGAEFKVLKEPLP